MRVNILTVLFVGFFINTKGQEVKQVTNIPFLQPNNLTSYKGKVYFSGYDLNKKQQLWVLDESKEGAHTITNFSRGTGIYEMLVFNEKLLISFPGERNIPNIHSYDLYISDGSLDGTYQFDGFPIDRNSFDRGNYIIHKNNLFYVYGHYTANPELWVTDGSSGGSKIIARFKRNNNGMAWGFYNFQNKIFFAADDGVNGTELWELDENQKVHLFKDVNPGIGSSLPSNFKEFSGKLFFSACDDCGAFGSNTQKIWITDGTPSGTHHFYNGNEPVYRLHSELKEFEKKIYFLTSDNKLCVCDGFSIREIFTFKLPQRGPFGKCNTRLVFEANDLDHGSELWSTDGSSSGTLLIKDIIPGQSSGNPIAQSFTFFNNKLYFFVNGGKAPSGIGIWKTEGTSISTEKVYPKSEKNIIDFHESFYNFGDSLYFIAVSNNIGRQIFKFENE